MSAEDQSRQTLSISHRVQRRLLLARITLGCILKLKTCTMIHELANFDPDELSSWCGSVTISLLSSAVCQL